MGQRSVPEKSENFENAFYGILADGFQKEATYRYNQNLLETIMKGEITPEVEVLVKRLGLENKLL